MGAKIRVDGAKKSDIYFKEWRTWKGWTQQELADALDVSRVTINRIENGSHEYNQSYLEAFAHVVGCDNIADPILRPPGKELPAPHTGERLSIRELKPHIHNVVRLIAASAGDRMQYDPDDLAETMTEILEYLVSEPEMDTSGLENVIKFQLRKLG